MTSDDVIVAARSWLDVPFIHQGRSREGVDCVGFVICCLRDDLSLLPKCFDVNGYGHKPDGTLFSECDKRLTRAKPKPGGIFVMRFAEEPQHMGFIVPYRHGGFAIIHALSRRHRIVEHRLDKLWESRILGTFEIPGVSYVG